MNRYLLGAVAFAAAAMTAGGCASNNKQAAAGKAPLQPLVTDIAPTPPAPVYIAPPQPVQQVAVAAPVAAEPAVTASAAGGGAYTVKRGDTLYKIAREHYGDGKAWNRIAAANPGLSPSSLKVGQRIVLPQ
jgi:nucleoid-associated protein YgaU